MQYHTFPEDSLLDESCVALAVKDLPSTSCKRCNLLVLSAQHPSAVFYFSGVRGTLIAHIAINGNLSA
jgi:hypothetical protein